MRDDLLSLVVLWDHNVVNEVDFQNDAKTNIETTLDIRSRANASRTIIPGLRNENFVSYVAIRKGMLAASKPHASEQCDYGSVQSMELSPTVDRSMSSASQY